MDRHSPRSVLLMLSAVIALGLAQTPLAASADDASRASNATSVRDIFIQRGYELARTGLSATQFAINGPGADMSGKAGS
jgi:hypothetical protein